MDKAAKAEQRIKTACDKLGITPGGRLWLDTALDPFKDITQKPQGFPDRIMAPSVVQTVHDTLSIAAPASVTTNWDCSIFMDQLWKQTPLRAVTPAFPSTLSRVSQTGGLFNRGGLVVRGAAAGVPLTISQTYNGLPYVTDVFNDDTSSRIIGIGMEIHNTTAEIYKQGSIITYRVSDEPSMYPITVVGDATIAGNSSTYMGVELVEAPITASQAVDLPGSLQWDAAKGAYIVPVFNQEDCTPSDLRPLLPYSVVNGTGVGFAPQITTTGATTGVTQPDIMNALMPFTLSGAYLTGLSKETTLAVNLTYYIEQFPSVDSALRRVSSPSAVEDYAAIELYTKVASVIPTGVEVNDNFLGAFVAGISRVITAVTPYVPRIVNFLSGAGEVVNTVSRTLDNHREIVQSQQPNNSRAIVPYKAPERKFNTEMVVHTNSNGSRDVIINNPPRQAQNNNNRNGRHVTQQHTVKNQRKKEYNRLDKYMKASNAGNRYIQ